MTNPIKKFFEILKAIVLFPVSFLQVRKAYQEVEKLRRLTENPEEERRILAEMGFTEDMLPLFTPMVHQRMHSEKINEVDLSYLGELDEEEEEEEIDD